LLEQLNAIDSARDVEFQRINTKLDGLRNERDQKLEALNAEIAKIKADFNEIESMAATQKERSAEEFAKQREGVSIQLTAIEEQQKSAGRYAQTTETITALSAELVTLESETESHTAALADIDAYKNDLLAKLPIPGLVVGEDGDIFRNGVQFDCLNTAQQVDIAVEIAKLRSGELGVVCVDRLECLDAPTMEAFRDAAIASGLQMFVTRVEDHPVTIEVYAEEN